jgi:hypothetical protein
VLPSAPGSCLKLPLQPSVGSSCGVNGRLLHPARADHDNAASAQLQPLQAEEEKEHDVDCQSSGMVGMGWEAKGGCGVSVESVTVKVRK